MTLKMDGCPNACGQHWMGNLGLQGTTARSESGDKIDAYDITLRGGLGSNVKIGKTLLRKIPTDEVTEVIVRLIKVWLGKRRNLENGGSNGSPDTDETLYSFQDFCCELTDQQIRAIALAEDIEEAHRYGKVTLRLEDVLVDYAGGIEEHEFKEAQVRDARTLIRKISRRYHRLGEEIPLEDGRWTRNVQILLNDRDIRDHEGLETSLEDGDQVRISPNKSKQNESAPEPEVPRDR